MYVGVIPIGARLELGNVSIPHVCGGDPAQVSWCFPHHQYSPCMWG